MKQIFTVEDYRERVRQLYQDEVSPLVRAYYLKIGVSIKSLLEQNKYLLIDEAGEQFEKDLFELINKKN
ncbi:hypothetical protein ETI10_10475 [Macrococcoides goetzii]|nr:hypothetical protein [Macrococcus goetzii]TDM39860.1 hypothetical protein ETI10_10475 [Macrococcus goetzii]